MDFNSLKNLNETDKTTLSGIFNSIINSLKHVSTNKASSLLLDIPNLCRMHHHSHENRKLKNLDPKKIHPIRPHRGEIYNASITEGIGSELSGNHLVVIIQNSKGNMFGEKVNILPIEGDGNKINPNYQIQLTNEDLETGTLDKNPSRIIVTDIMTIEKARLGRRIGQVNPECIKKINKLLKSQLSL